MTAELETALAQLENRQIQFINDLIAVGYLAERPLAPYSFLFGSTSPTAEYTRWPGNVSRPAWSTVPQYDDEGNLIKRPGWSHQPEFVHALQLAKRLARKRYSRQLLQAIEDAYSHAARAAPDVIGNLVSIATDTALGPDGQPANRGTRDADQINAASKILPILSELRNENREDQETDDEAADWWSALDD